MSKRTIGGNNPLARSSALDDITGVEMKDSGPKRSGSRDSEPKVKEGETVSESRVNYQVRLRPSVIAAAKHAVDWIRPTMTLSEFYERAVTAEIERLKASGEIPKG